MNKNKNGWYEFIIPFESLDYIQCKDWCEENISDYKILYLLSGLHEVAMAPLEYNIVIKNEEDALAFKLRWL